LSRARSAAACVLLAAAGCGGKAPAPAGAVSSSIAILQSGQLAVVNPDQGSVSFLDAQSLAVLGTVSVGGDPHALLQLQSGDLWVSTYHGGQVVSVDPGTQAVKASASLCEGPYGMAESPDRTWVAVTCEWSGQVLRVDPSGLTATPLASGLQRPRGVVIVGSTAVVSELAGGNVAQVSSAGAVTRLSLVPSAAAYRPELTLMTANLAASVVPAFGHLFVAHELVNHTGDSTDEVAADDYGTVVDGTPKINAAATRLTLSGETVSAPADTPPVYSRFDVATHAFSGPVAAAPFGSRFLLVAHQSTNDVAVLDTTATDPNQRLLATYEVGAAPSGLAVDPAGQVAYVDNAFDASVSRLDLTLAQSPSGPSYTPSLTLVRTLASPYSAAALVGRKLFYDATNPHVTPSRVVACATCHPGGADDGLIWFMHTASIPLKRRRTPHLANSHTGTAPYHWDGEFATMADLVNATVTGLMAGDGLLVDGSTVQAFVDEIVQPAVPPAQDAAAVARGQTMFQSTTAACATCHIGTEFTDGLEHAVLTPMSLTSDDVFTAANTPNLHGLFFRAPFFHDGRSPSLEDLLTRSDASAHGDLVGASAQDISDLMAYLSSL
jgi:DNA-binding beta-propeller fold protein YncE